MYAATEFLYMASMTEKLKCNLLLLVLSLSYITSLAVEVFLQTKLHLRQWDSGSHYEILSSRVRVRCMQFSDYLAHD